MGEALAASGRLALMLVTVAACAGGEPGGPRGGTLEVQWVGGDTGKLVAPAVAEWCDSLRLLELRAVRGDTGIALALYPAESVTAGRYPMGRPERGDSTRPSSALALRWFTETSIRGFQSDSGSVSIAGGGPGAVGGSFAARLRSTTEGSRLSVTGSFRGLTVRPAPAECAGVAKVPADSEPDPEEEHAQVPEGPLLERGRLSMDPARHRVTWAGRPVSLTVTEFLILEALAQRPGVIKSRNQLMDAAYPDDVFVDDRTVDSHIKRLRRKFRAVDPEFGAIETLYGAGYSFSDG